MKVIIPVYHSAYLRGDRTGTVLTVGKLRGMGDNGSVEIARVELDRSGRTILVDFGDCQQLGGSNDHPAS